MFQLSYCHGESVVRHTIGMSRPLVITLRPAQSMLILLLPLFLQENGIKYKYTRNLLMFLRTAVDLSSPYCEQQIRFPNLPGD